MTMNIGSPEQGIRVHGVETRGSTLALKTPEGREVRVSFHGVIDQVLRLLEELANLAWDSVAVWKDVLYVNGKPRDFGEEFSFTVTHAYA